jgi:hypothetical protein
MRQQGDRQAIKRRQDAKRRSNTPNYTAARNKLSSAGRE